MAAVSPARAPDDMVMCGRGVVTMAEVMLTMRPKRFSIMEGSTARTSIMGATILASSAPIQCSSSLVRKSRGSGPALLLTRMSGAGQAASRAARPSLVVTSATTARTCPPVDSRSSRRASSRRTGSRPLMTTSTPSFSSASAQARPSPRLDAQTMAILPAIPRSTLSSLDHETGGKLAGNAPRVCPVRRKRMAKVERRRERLDKPPQAPYNAPNPLAAQPHRTPR